MRGVCFTGDRTVAILDKPDPRPGPGEVVVQMKAAAVCGSDLHRYRRPAESVGNTEVFVGHEPCGVVVETGPSVTLVKPGDRVVVFHRRSCGACEMCRQGNLGSCPHTRSHGNHYDGGDADYLVTDDRNCLPMPDDMSFVAGALVACNAGTAYNAVKKTNVRGGETLTVFGLGPVGLCTLLCARANGARVVGVDISQSRMETALSLGATAVIDASKEDVRARVRELTDGRGTETAVDTSGSASAHAALVSSLGYKGRGVVVGFGNANPSVNLCEIIGRQLTLQGSSIFTVGDYWEMVRFFRNNNIDLESVVTHRFPISEGAEAFRVADAAGSGKVVFTWE